MPTRLLTIIAYSLKIWPTLWASLLAMYFVLQSRRVSQKSAASIVRYSQKKGMHFFCFLLFWESFNCYNFGTTGPIQVGFSAKCTSPNEHFNQIENWKCHMFDFRRIPQDRITFKDHSCWIPDYLRQVKTWDTV